MLRQCESHITCVDDLKVSCGDSKGGVVATVCLVTTLYYHCGCISCGHYLSPVLTNYAGRKPQKNTSFIATETAEVTGISGVSVCEYS
jgi:hypothetical protein